MAHSLMGYMQFAFSLLSLFLIQLSSQNCFHGDDFLNPSFTKINKDNNFDKNNVSCKKIRVYYVVPSDASVRNRQAWVMDMVKKNYDKWQEFGLTFSYEPVVTINSNKNNYWFRTNDNNAFRSDYDNEQYWWIGNAALATGESFVDNYEYRNLIFVETDVSNYAPPSHQAASFLNFAVIPKDYIDSKNYGVVAHELGHVFGLLHRVGCSITTGATPTDFMCDTDAPPFDIMRIFDTQRRNMKADFPAYFAETNNNCKCTGNVVLTVSSTQNSNRTYKDASQINTSSTISANKSINFYAGDLVVMKPGFWAKPNSAVRAITRSCSPGGNKQYIDDDLSDSVISDGSLNSFPIPFDSELNVQFSDELLDSEEAIISIFSLSGQLMLTQLADTAYDLLIDTQSWPKGIYILQFSSKSHTLKQKIVK